MPNFSHYDSNNHSSTGGSGNNNGSNSNLYGSNAMNSYSTYSVSHSSSSHHHSSHHEKRVGIYTIEERRIKIEKFRERKRQRIWRKQIKYDCRKRLADTRPR
jgi:hypothetical protein